MNNLLKSINHEKIGKILFEMFPDMLAILNVDGKILDCNKKLEEYTYYEKHELLGLVGPVDLIVNEDVQTAVSAFEELKIKDIKQNVPLKMKRKDDSVFPSIWSGATLRNESNELEEYLVTGKDLSKLQELENRVIESNDRINQEKLALVGELSSKLAHNIRNPLSIISITLENLKLINGKNEYQEKQFEKVSRAISRITHQIDDVLDFIKKQPLKIDKIKFSDLLADSLDSLYIPNNVLLELPRNDVELNCDARKLSVVFTNIILNAIQSIEGTGTIEIRLEDNQDSIIVETKDSGKGISQKDIKHIFEPLYTTKQTGTGLGLASVKSIIESHGGIISVTSPPTIFKITLPKNSS